MQGRIFEEREQNAASLDAAAIRKLASQITGRLITPEAPIMNHHAWSAIAHTIGTDCALRKRTGRRASS
jgi:hypothetical protein